MVPEDVDSGQGIDRKGCGMRIALITHHYEPENNAPQRRWSALVPRFIAAGHEVVVFTPPAHYPSGRLEDVTNCGTVGESSTGRFGETIHRVRFREHGHDLRSRSVDQAVVATSSAWAAIRKMRGRGKQPDVVISTVPGLPSIAAGWLVAAILGARHVVEMRDAWPDLIESSGMMNRASLRRRFATHVAKVAVTKSQRRAAAVVTTTQSFAEVLRERGVQRVEVIRNGASLDDVSALPTRVEHGGPLRVLYAGTLGRSQGLATAVEAAALAQQAGHPVQLRLLGSGACEDELREQITELNAPVELLGRVPRGEVRAHYAWADTALVSLEDWPPFLWTTPSKVYEAIALRRHVTGCVRGETEKLILDIQAGDVVHPGDATALARTWGELSLDRSRLVVPQCAREWTLANVNSSGLADSYLGLLEDLVSQKVTV